MYIIFVYLFNYSLFQSLTHELCTATDEDFLMYADREY
jgi:hypothetical protein